MSSRTLRQGPQLPRPLRLQVRPPHRSRHPLPPFRHHRPRQSLPRLRPCSRHRCRPHQRRSPRLCPPRLLPLDPGPVRQREASQAPSPRPHRTRPLKTPFQHRRRNLSCLPLSLHPSCAPPGPWNRCPRLLAQKRRSLLRPSLLRSCARPCQARALAAMSCCANPKAPA